MNRIFTLIFSFILLAGVLSLNAQERYLDEVFTDIEVQDSIIYGSNTTIITALNDPPLPPARRPLFVNVLTPSGDTDTERPLILLFHTGNFLPQLVNGQINGNINDPYLNVLAGRLTRMGYVVGVVDYRQGWNPIGEQEERTNTLLNAAYRGIQDANTCVRFFRRSVAEQANPFGIDPSKIVTFGLGTGGYIALGAATLDQYEDVVLPQFIGSDINGDGVPDPFVIDFINGDPFALEVGVNPFTGDTLCFVNHPGFSSEIQLGVNLGGALGDSTWIDTSDPPVMSFHVPTDPFAPYTEGTVIVPTTGDFVVDVIGSFRISEISNAIGNNSVWDNATFTDPYSQAANSRNLGNEGVFPFPRQDWDLTDDGVDNPTNVEASPWEFWDETFWSTEPFGQLTLSGDGAPCQNIPIDFCNWHIISLMNNPDMTVAKGTAYQDSILGYFAPRACVALDLPCRVNFEDSATEELLPTDLVSATPNPASDFIDLTSELKIISVEIVGIDGRVISRYNNLNHNNYRLDNLSELSGLHVINVRLEEGLVSKTVHLE